VTIVVPRRMIFTHRAMRRSDRISAAAKTTSADQQMRQSQASAGQWRTCGVAGGDLFKDADVNMFPGVTGLKLQGAFALWG
jgi:hypothetical protein